MIINPVYDILVEKIKLISIRHYTLMNYCAISCSLCHFIHSFTMENNWVFEWQLQQIINKRLVIIWKSLCMFLAQCQVLLMKFVCDEGHEQSPYLKRVLFQKNF